MPGHSPTGSAETVFAQHLASLPSGAEADIEALCREHPDLALDLRAVNQNYRALLPVLRLAGLDPHPQRRLADEIRSRFGDEADPHVSLEGAPGEAPSPSSELLKRLEAHAPSNFRYRLVGEVGRGGMGAVLRVWDEDLRRTLAMKVVLGKEDSAATGNTPPVDSRTLGRFLEEAQVTGQLDHPGIVPVHELGLDSGGRVYFTMKLVKGEDLRHIYEHVLNGKDGWNQTRALSVLLKVCEALSYAHDKGVIHRDLKPANVMVGKYGEVYVMDWGLARVLGKKDRHDLRIQAEPQTSVSVQTERRAEREETPDSPIVTMDGDVVGTPAYMPPEQARGDTAALAAQSDVYAVGAMLYHLLAGQMPFVPKNAKVSARTVLMRVLEGPPLPVHTLAPAAPAELVAICEKAMAREAPRRYSDTRALADDLRAFLEHRVVAAYETGTWAESRKWVQRNKPLAASLATAVLLLAAGLTAQLAANTTIQAKRVELEIKNSALDAATRSAQASATSAKEQEALAESQEAQAKREKANVLKLSAFQTLDDLTKEADELWPAEPGRVEQYRDWMKRAEALVSRLPEFRASLAEIEQRALPRTEEERIQDRSSDPRAQEFEALKDRLTWMRRMLGQEPWPSEAEAELSLSKVTLPTDPAGLIDLVLPLVGPDRSVYGSELKGLLLTRRALALAVDERPFIREWLAWAYFQLGRFDEALAESAQGLDEVESTKREEYQSHQRRLRQEIDRWRDAQDAAGGPGDKAHAERLQERDKLVQAVDALDAELSLRRTWRFAEDAVGAEGGDRWWHNQQQNLVAALESFGDAKTGLMHGVSELHGWGVGKRLLFVLGAQERTQSGEQARKDWGEAIAAIASSPKYGGLKLHPQFGLLPLGADPVSGLWEFAHLETGEPAVRGPDRTLRLKEETGIVFVLIPAGTFWMGAQKTDPQGQNFDPLASADEAPVHEATLSPYFLSKYEMTQGQWERFTGKDPSQYRKSSYQRSQNRAGKKGSSLHPVEQVSWITCMKVLGLLGCELPSEAQWENGCRGGTNSAYWSGNLTNSLGGVANIADAFSHQHGGDLGFPAWEKDIDDGNSIHAEVGSYRANPFGLHDVHGNVWEWCRDGYAVYSAAEQLDPVAPWARTSLRVSRGGGFAHAAVYARSALRVREAPEYQNGALGLRPAMDITP